MKNRIQKLLIVSSLLGVTSYGMMPTDRTLLEGIQTLPQDLKRYIVFIVLELTLSYDYVQERTVQAGGHLRAFALSLDGKTFLTGLYGNNAYVCDLQTGGVIHKLKGHTDPISSVAFSLDGNTILTGSNDTTARLWDCSTGKQLKVFERHTDEIRSVVFSSDGNTILTGSRDTTARLWDIPTGNQLQVFKGHTDTIAAVAFSPDGKTVLTGSWDKTARLWDSETAKQLQVFMHGNSVSSVTFSSDGKAALTGSRNGSACVWGVTTPVPLQMLDWVWGVTTPVLLQTLDGLDPANLQTLGGPGPVNSVAFSSDGNTVLAASDYGNVRLGDIQTGELLLRLPHDSAVSFIAVILDSDTIVTGQDDGTITVFKRLFRSPWVEKRKKSAWKLFTERELKVLLMPQEASEAPTVIQTECSLQ